jgi:glycosyltransferase involved in cell wall biosynthesis
MASAGSHVALIDAHLIGAQETGNETYTAGLLGQADVFAAAGWRVCALMPAPRPDLIAPAQTVADPRCANDLYRFFCALPRALAELRAGLLHVNYHAPFWIKTPYVVMIHDISYRARPRFTSPRNFALQNILGWLTALRASAVTTPSHFSRREVARLYPWLRDRAFVTPNAVKSAFYPRPSAEVEQVKKAFDISAPYFLFVGTPQPRKNIARVVEAFLAVTRKVERVQLVIAGKSTPELGKLRRAHQAAFASGRVVATGYVSDDDLACLYSGCIALVFPSLYEGFGIPVLEAMACGAPVITSNTTALPEAAGDAALLVNPEDTMAIAQAIRRMLDEPALRAHLRARGFAHARQFTWARTARATAEAYQAATEWYRRSGR